MLKVIRRDHATVSSVSGEGLTAALAILKHQYGSASPSTRDCGVCTGAALSSRLPLLCSKHGNSERLWTDRDSADTNLRRVFLGFFSA